MMASTRWRSQFGNGRGVVSSLRIRVRPRSGLAKNASVSSPARPLSVTTAVPGAGRLAGLSSSICLTASAESPVNDLGRKAWGLLPEVSAGPDLCYLAPACPDDKLLTNDQEGWSSYSKTGLRPARTSWAVLGLNQ
jgi:hypothetical protein